MGKMPKQIREIRERQYHRFLANYVEEHAKYITDYTQGLYEQQQDLSKFVKSLFNNYNNLTSQISLIYRLFNDFVSGDLKTVTCPDTCPDTCPEHKKEIDYKWYTEQINAVIGLINWLQVIKNMDLHEAPANTDIPSN